VRDRRPRAEMRGAGPAPVAPPLAGSGAPPKIRKAAGEIATIVNPA
jgi:hypothetical protein